MPRRSVAERLTPRRRCVLYLRAAGWSYEQIASEMGVTRTIVHRDVQAVNAMLIPGVTSGPEPAKSYRVIYTLGLLDGGVDPEDVPDHLEALPEKAKWLALMDRVAGSDAAPDMSK